MAEYKHQWKEIKPGHWFRKFAPFEKTEYHKTCAIPGVRQRHIAAGISLSENYKEISIEAIKKAWMTLRYEQPMIGCSVDETGYHYTTPNGTAEVQSWVEATVRVDASGLSGREVAASATAPETSELYYLPKSEEIFLHVRHDIADAIGAVLLLNNFLRALRDGQKSVSFGDGSETSRLPPSLDQIMNSVEPSPSLTDQAKEVLDRFLNSKPLFLKLRSLKADTPLQSQRFEYQFSRTETSQFLKICKTKGITITHAATAASALATLEHSEEESGDICASYPMSMRNVLPAPYNSPEYAATFYTTSDLQVLSVSKSSDFLEYAKEVQNIYRSAQNNKNITALAAAILNHMENTGGAHPATKAHSTLSITVSSLGIVEKYLTEATDDFWLNIVTVTPVVGTFMYTVKGQLRLIVCYNSNNYGSADPDTESTEHHTKVKRVSPQKKH
ncbi:hypothetical protein H072_8528 [Dactylellina haptotyla CBS 200.50]|uniref:Condensation domain-containing protein n=1 Tax=Dactylellina haptotyla (strain CBS 200.50) TaxID=1284197 RepID=S8A437_DACHA|nr:hypothetical protein H072_8528 [Dactylellina haptotyla CBS 200.50]